MKKVLLISLLVVAFTLLFSAAAFANNGPHLGGVNGVQINGGFAQDTDACAGCHRAHTGLQAKLLKTGTNVYGFCTSCHDGTGANTNVNTGLFEGDLSVVYTGGQDSINDGTAGKGLNGGGFVNAVGYNGRSNRGPDDGGLGANYGAVTSTHTVEGLGGGGLGTAWGGGTTGYGDDGSGATSGTLTGGGQLTLKCTSCHDPHGSKNPTGSDKLDRYRILLNKVTRYDGQVTPEDVSATAIMADEPDSAVDGKNYTSIRYLAGTAAFCSACHTQYNSLSSDYDAKDGKGYTTRYRHPVNKELDDGVGATPPKTGNGKTITENLNEATHVQLPAEQAGGYAASYANGDKVVCLSCHQAHGTKASMTDNSKVGPTATAPLTGSSTLLRLNDRGVCQDCHQK